MAKKLDPALLIGGEEVDGLGELNEIEAEQVEGALGFAELAFKALTLSVMVDRAEVKVLEAIGERGGGIAVGRADIGQVGGEGEDPNGVRVGVGAVVTEQEDDDGGDGGEAVAYVQLPGEDAAGVVDRAVEDGVGVLALDLDVVSDASLVSHSEIEDEAALAMEGGGMLGLDVGQVGDSTIAFEREQVVEEIHQDILGRPGLSEDVFEDDVYCGVDQGWG